MDGKSHDMMEQFGKILVLVGLCVVAGAGMLNLLGRLGIGPLPGDVSLGGKHWRIYLPIGTCIILSALLTVLVFIITHLRK